MLTQILLALWLLLTGIIGYFLRDSMKRLKDVEILTENNGTEIKLINLSADLKSAFIMEKFEELKETLTTLTGEIKDLNKTISNK